MKLEFEVYGIDLNCTTVTYGIKTFGIKGFCGLIEDAPYPDNFFDVIVMNQVIEHLADPDLDLSHCHRLLKPGGLLLIRTGACQDNKNFSVNWKYCGPSEYYYFTISLLKMLIERNRFKVIAEQDLVNGDGNLEIRAVKR